MTFLGVVVVVVAVVAKALEAGLPQSALPGPHGVVNVCDRGGLEPDRAFGVGPRERRVHGCSVDPRRLEQRLHTGQGWPG